MSKLVLIFSSFFVPNILCNIVDYCAPRICPSGTHTGCHNNGRFSSACPPDIKVERMNLAQKQQILDLHNYYRMQVALGNVETFITGVIENFPTASRMMRLVWEEQQAVNALLQLKTCLSHDSCHNTFINATTNRPISSGQNIAFMFTTGKAFTIESTLDSAALNWFKESEVTPLDVIDSLYYTDNFTIGHFTQLIHDQNTSVGCAMVRWTEENGTKKCSRVTCNYRKANYGNQPVYDKGEACSKCNVCDEDEYLGLCIE